MPYDMIVMLIIVQSNVILYYCIIFDFRIRREGCKSAAIGAICVVYGLAPPSLRRPDPLSFKWIGGEFERGLARSVVNKELTWFL